MTQLFKLNYHTHVSSINVIPKYSFSFRLKCEATRSSNSRDKSLGYWKNKNNFIHFRLLIKNKKYWHLSTYGHAKTLLYNWIHKWHIRLRVSQWSCVGCVEHGEAILCLIYDIKLKGKQWVLLSSFWGKRQHPRLSCTYGRKDFSIKKILWRISCFEFCYRNKTSSKPQSFLPI